MKHIRWPAIEYLPESPPYAPPEYDFPAFPERTPRSCRRWPGKKRVLEQEAEKARAAALQRLKAARYLSMAASEPYDWTSMSKSSRSDSSNVEDRLLLDIRKVLRPLIAQGGEGKQLTSRQSVQSIDFDLAVRLLKFLSQFRWLPEVDEAVVAAFDGSLHEELTLPQHRLRSEIAAWLQAYADCLNQMDRSPRRYFGEQYLRSLAATCRYNLPNFPNLSRTNSLPNRRRPSRPIQSRNFKQTGSDDRAPKIRITKPVPQWLGKSKPTGKRTQPLTDADLVEELE